jgi:hypothetical protein
MSKHDLHARPIYHRKRESIEAHLTIVFAAWAGDATILLSYVKGRAAAESLTLPKKAVRLLEQWLAHSALLRGHTGTEVARELWLGVTRPGSSVVFSGPIGRNAVKAWAVQRALTGDDGEVLKIRRGRIRTTHLAMRDRRAWAGQGRAVIDPNHSPQVEGDHYLTATTPAQRRAVEAIVEDAQHDLLRRAHPPTVITDEDAAALARGYPRLIEALELDDTVITELVGGERDVFTAACADQLSGVHGPKGKTLPGQAMGVPAVPAGGVRAAARLQPAAAEGVLHPAVAADARRRVHGRVRPVLPADRPGPGPARPDGAGRRGPRRRRPRRRAAAAARGGHTMTAVSALTAPAGPAGSVFAGVDVCRVAGLPLPDGARRPIFEDDLWDLAEVVGLPVQLALQHRRFDFALIGDPRWQLVAKELVMALLAPGHQAVACLGRAYRAPHHVSTCHGRLAELIRFMKWLTANSVASLEDLRGHDCDAYLAHRRYQRDDHGAVVGERSPGTRRLAALIVTDLLNYRELFTADRVPADLRPWGGATPSAIAEDTRAGQNKTPPASDDVLAPMLAAALHLVTVIGPHAVELAAQVRAADRDYSAKADGLKAVARVPLAEITRLLAGYERTGKPLPLLQDRHVRDRINAGWSPDDPLRSRSMSWPARPGSGSSTRPGCRTCVARPRRH